MNNTINVDELVKLLTKENDSSLSLDNAVRIFLQEIKANRSEATYRFYHEMEIPCIIQFLKSNGITQTIQIDNKIIQEFIVFERAKGNTNNTINKKVGALKTMLNYLIKCGYIEKPILNIPKLKVIEKQIEMPNDEDLVKLLNYLKGESPKKQLVFNLIMETGVRRTELCLIERKNVNLAKNQIWLCNTKNKKPRYLYISDDTKELIKKTYIQYDSEWLIPSDKNPSEHMHPHSISIMFTYVKHDLGIENFSPHKLRHKFGTSLIESNVNVEKTRLLLGHSSYYMTMRYVHLNNEQLRDESINNNILAKLKKDKNEDLRV